MKKFMIVCASFDEGLGKTVYKTVFTDSQAEANHIRMDVSCGLGGRAQIYEWDDEEDCYGFLWE